MNTEFDQWMGREGTFDGNADFIVGFGPFKLLIQARGRRISRGGMLVELKLLDSPHKWAAEDLHELLPVGRLVQLQLRHGTAEGSSSIVSGTIEEVVPQGQLVFFRLRFRKVDEEFEEFLAELKPELPL